MNMKTNAKNIPPKSEKSIEEPLKPNTTQDKPMAIPQSSIPPQTPPTIDATQPVETNAYVPTYKVKPEFRQAIIKAIGDLPFNQIAGLINAIEVSVIDHQTLTQIVNALGQFPFTRVEHIMKNVGNYVTQVIED